MPVNQHSVQGTFSRCAMSVAGAVFFTCFAVALYGWLHPPKKADKPPHVVFFTNGGPVIFPHLHHSDPEGSAASCTDCHHKYNPDAKTAVEMRCRTCHYSRLVLFTSLCSADKMHPRCIGKRCSTCHDGEECTFCHRKPQ